MKDVKEQIRIDYLSGIPPKKLAEKYDMSINSIKSWIKRYGWSKIKKQGAPLDDEGAPSKAESAPRNRVQNEQINEAVAEEVEQVLENPKLTDKQRLFCLYYVRCFNATKAYQKAYRCSYDVANAEGYKLLVNPCIKDEIRCLKQNRLNREMLDEYDIFQKYMDIAFADITDYVEFGREEAPVMGAFGPVKVSDPETGKKVPLTKAVNVVRFKESYEIDGTLISEVKQGKDGASVKLMDRMKALSWIAEHMDLATKEQKARIEQLKAQTQKITGEGLEIEDMSEIEAEIYEADQEKENA